jgi:hypothetical protein
MSQAFLYVSLISFILGMTIEVPFPWLSVLIYESNIRILIAKGLLLVSAFLCIARLWIDKKERMLRRLERFSYWFIMVLSFLGIVIEFMAGSLVMFYLKLMGKI